MKISIYSRKSIEELLRGNFPQNAAVISFYDPPGKFRDEEYKPVDYSTKTNCVFQVALHDIDLERLCRNYCWSTSQSEKKTGIVT